MDHLNKIADNIRQLFIARNESVQPETDTAEAPRLPKGEKLSVCTDCILIAFLAYGHTYEATFYTDGLGLLYDDLRNPKGEADAGFTHDLNLRELRQSLHGDALRERLEEYFWREVNPKLEQPLVKDQSDLEKYELEFVTGSREEFERLIQLFILTEPDEDVLASSSFTIVIRCGAREDADIDNPEPHLLDWYYNSDRMRALVNLALKEHYPRGYRYEWNDGAVDRLWGYALRADELEFELDYDVPARKRMAARAELREWLLARGQNPADYGLDDWEKIT
jgi:hypothetical protein